MAHEIRIGVAGWSIGSVNAGLFPAEGSSLQRYAARFDAAEINSSFYRPHRVDTYRRWAESTPENFRFSVKLPKAATHEKRLVDTEAVLDRFAAELAGLGEKFAILLVQLPPSLIFEPRTVETFFAAARARFSVPIACEPRHASWFTPDAQPLLEHMQVARVAADPPRAEGGDHPGGWDGLRYWRWHGSPRVYATEYGEPRLEPLAQAVEGTSNTPCWVVFDNTASSSAVRDAARLQARLRAGE